LPKVGTRDLRIASITLELQATLVTRNARDFNEVPGLKLDIWN
jgi:tRNA(fMet)-specific endonuclease VapC